MSAQDYREKLYDSYVSENRQHRVAGHRDPHQEHQKLALRVRLRSWLKDVRRDQPVVDLGCGAGTVMEVLRASGFTNVEGVDISVEQVEIAKQRGLTAVRADVFAHLLTKDDDGLELVTAFDLFEHLKREELISLLELIKAKLRPGGLLVYQLPNGDSPFVGSVFWSDATHETLLTAHSLRHLLGTAGFAKLEFAESVPPPVRFSWAVRYVLWKVIRAGIGFCHRVETGGSATGYYTRVIFGRAVKPA
jgi:predicted TPR repeat methyltransferase